MHQTLCDLASHLSGSILYKLISRQPMSQIAERLSSLHLLDCISHFASPIDPQRDSQPIRHRTLTDGIVIGRMKPESRSLIAWGRGRGGGKKKREGEEGRRGRGEEERGGGRGDEITIICKI